MPISKALCVDVIIPTFEPDEKFHLLMRKLRQQTYPVNKILIMNTGTILPEEAHYRRHLKQESAGGHVPVLEVYHLDRSEFDHGGTRNLAMSFSSAEIAIFMTQDAVPENEELIARLVEPFLKKDGVENYEFVNGKMYRENNLDHRLAAVYARQIPAENCPPLERFSRGFNYPDVEMRKSRKDLKEIGIKTYFCSNACAAYQREIWERVGGFPSPAIFNEDMIFAGHAVNAGYEIFYAPAARVVHSHNYGFLVQFRRNFDMAVSQTQHPEVFEGVKSEPEGVKYVKEAVKWTIAQGKPWLLVPLVWQSGWKYLGYKLGRNYQKLPMFLVKRFSWQKSYWK